SKLDCNLINCYKDLVFVDVPGYDTDLHPVSDFMDNFPFGHFDTFVFVVKGKLYHADEKIFSRIRSSGKSVVVTRSFKDGMSKEDVLASQKDISSRLSLDAPIIFFSNRTKENVDAVLKSVVG
ncbi:MAG: hypothetical protein Q9N68_05360, partial [Gammaproteobacteria bacterium]|nr:hypothetical protein [Gammaproteobacteria bacterium]